MMGRAYLFLGIIALIGAGIACSTASPDTTRQELLRSGAIDPPRILDPEGGGVDGGIAPCCLEVYETQSNDGWQCTDSLQCCSNNCVITDDSGAGYCQCADLGGYCYVNSDCCTGTCNTPEGCCVDDSGECIHDGGNPWLDGQL